MKIRIVIADDHPLVISGLHHMLGSRQDMELVGSFTNGKDLLGQIGKLSPDVLLLDIQMPGATGDEVAEVIYDRYPKIRMLALTNLDNVYYIKNMLKKGVLGYVLKTTRVETLLEAIRTVYEGKKYLGPALMEKVVADSITHDDAPDVPVLSRREREILRYIAENLNSQQIADKLFISKRTVDNHRTSLLTKLGVKNVASLVKKAIQIGLIG